MKKKIYVCPKCGRALNFSTNPNYTFHCERCDMLWHNHEAKEIEQPRMEGVVDFTNLAKASMEIKAITDKATVESRRQIEIKSQDIVGQVCEYISETIKPIINSGVYKDTTFRDCARIYNAYLRLDFNDYGGVATGYQAQLFGVNGFLRVYFNGENKYIIDQMDTNKIHLLVESWPGFKDAMNCMIAYGLKECDKANQKRIEKQEELFRIINGFKL